MVAVEFELVNRLVRAALPQFVRAVGCDDDERHARLGGFDDRGVKVGGGCAGRRKHHNRALGRARHAQRKERRAAFIQQRDDLDVWCVRQRQRQRCGARTRRDDRMLDAGARQFVHKDGCPEGVAVGVRVCVHGVSFTSVFQSLRAVGGISSRFRAIRVVGRNRRRCPRPRRA